MWDEIGSLPRYVEYKCDINLIIIAGSDIGNHGDRNAFSVPRGDERRIDLFREIDPLLGNRYFPS